MSPNYSEFDAERDQKYLPLLWMTGILMLAMGLPMLVTGLFENGHPLLPSSIVILPGAINILRHCVKIRRKIKEFETQKNLASYG